MNTKAGLFSIVVISIITLLLYFLNISNDYRSDHFSCQGKMEFNNENKKYSAQIRYVFDGGKGNVYALGEYSESGKGNKKIPQHVQFTYTRNGKEIIMVSKRTSLNDKQAISLNTFIPDFYLYKGRGFRINIFRQGDGYVFTSNDIPIFICTKTTK